MKIIEAKSLKSNNSHIARPTSICIGNFDGCHLGHQELIRLCIKQARQLDLTPLVITFNPHPRIYFSKSKKENQSKTLEEKLLFSKEQKSRCLKELGVKLHLEQSFTSEFANQSKEEFFYSFLLKHLSCKALTIGHDFKFGKGRLGCGEWLKTVCPENDVSFTQVEASKLGENAISSTLVRKNICELGNVDSAKELLGRPYLIEGKVRKGKRIGHQLGFPTANLLTDNQLLPLDGVYLAQVYLQESEIPIFPEPKNLLPAVVNIGSRPTVDSRDARRVIEAHILDGFKQELYGKNIGIYLLHRVREEKNFSNLEELKRQISNDVDTANQYFKMK